MRTVIFPFVQNENHAPIFPDDAQYFSDMRSIADGTYLTASYTGDLSETDLPNFNPPELTINSIDCNDPSFYFDKATGFIAVKAGVDMSINASISNFPHAEKWNTPMFCYNEPKGFLQTASDEQGNVTLVGSFPWTGEWEINEKTINSELPPEKHFIFKLGITAKVSS